MKETARFALIQLERESRDPMALAKALASAHETPVQDQVLAANKAWRIVAEDLPESDARALGQALRSSGAPIPPPHDLLVLAVDRALKVDSPSVRIRVEVQRTERNLDLE